MTLRRSMVPAVSAILVTVSAPSAALGAYEYSVYGRLVDPAARPIAGATVVATEVPQGRDAFEMRFAALDLPEAGRTSSDREGVFELALPAEGCYRIRIRADGYLPADQPVLVHSPEPVLLPQPVWRPARRARLVVEGADGRPVAGARIRVAGSGHEWGMDAWQAFAVTGEDGSAALVVPAGAAVDAFVVAPGFATSRLRLEAGERTIVRLAAGSPLAVEVVDANKRPLPEVAVFWPTRGCRSAAPGKTARRWSW